jgi:hypothetical protein
MKPIIVPRYLNAFFGSRRITTNRDVQMLRPENSIRSKIELAKVHNLSELLSNSVPPSGYYQFGDVQKKLAGLCYFTGRLPVLATPNQEREHGEGGY